MKSHFQEHFRAGSEILQNGYQTAIYQYEKLYIITAKFGAPDEY